MRCLLLVAALSFGGLTLGCAPAVSQASQEVAPSQTELNQEPAKPSATEPSSVPVATLTPTSTKSPTPASPSPTPVDPPATQTPTPFPAITTAAPTDPPLPTSVIPDTDAAELVIDGLELYRQQNCSTCHRLDAAGAYGKLGPTHNGLVDTAETRLHDPYYTGAATSPAEYIRESIVKPEIYLVTGYNSPRQKMPAFTNLSQVELEALVQFLLQQK